jgi:peroxiredoxin
MMHKNDIIPMDYFDTINILPVYNPDGIFSYEYYYFVDTYAWSKYITPDLEKADVLDRFKVMLPKCLSFADSLLKGEIKDIFLYWTIVNNPITENFNDLADTLIASYKDKFSNPKYEELLVAANNKSKLLVSHLEKGDKAPEFYLSNEKGEYVQLKDFKGKIIVLNFWATWCKPCRMEVPAEEKLIEKFSDKDFQLVNICLTDSLEDMVKAVKELNMKGINLYAQGNWVTTLRKNYNVGGIPHYVLIDRNGNILDNYSRQPSTGLDKDIEALIKNN